MITYFFTSISLKNFASGSNNNSFVGSTYQLLADITSGLKKVQNGMKGDVLGAPVTYNAEVISLIFILWTRENLA